jgi:hypothetical protein
MWHHQAVLLRTLWTALVVLLAMIGAGFVLGMIARALGAGSAWLTNLHAPMVQLAVAIVLLLLVMCMMFGFRDLARILMSRY